MVKIATWNVNSVRARLANIIDWLESAKPDVLLLQEIKTLEETFPLMDFKGLGYQVLIAGQKSYNGVAILSRDNLTDPITRLPGEPADEQARYLEATTFGLRVASIYLPNGNPVASEKYPYKLRWMARLRDHARELLLSEQAVILAGDYNVIPAPLDVYEPSRWTTDALYKIETRHAFREILNLGYTEAFRALHPKTSAYTYWDYQGIAWSADQGLRIDHLLLSPQAADRLTACEIDRKPRGKEKASDHTPIWIEVETAVEAAA